MKRLATLTVVLVLFAGGCRSLDPATGPGAAGGPPVRHADRDRPTTGPTVAGSPTPARASFPDDGPAGLLARSAPSGTPTTTAWSSSSTAGPRPRPPSGYRDRITTDPADLPVPLAGAKFVYLALHGARLDTAPVVSDSAQARKYTGLTRFTPGYPVLREMATAGDFEGVLSFGLGLSTVAGLSSTSGPGVFTSTCGTPRRTAWCGRVTSVSQAEDLQRGAESGHQPWTLVAAQVAGQYVQQVLGWGSGAQSSTIGPQVYQFTAGTRLAVVTVRQPLGRTGTVWAVASVVT